MNATVTSLKTIKYIPVTPLGIEVNDLDQITSEKGKLAIYQAVCFGGVQTLLSRTAQYAKMTSLLERLKKEGRIMEATTLEASDRFMKAREAAEKAAQRLAVIHAKAEQSFSILLDFTPMMQRSSSQADLAKKAEFAGVDVSHVQAIEARNALKKYEEAANASHLAEAMFYSVDITQQSDELNADGDEAIFDGEVPAYIHPEMAMKALIRLRDYILSWNTPDWAELGLLKDDIAAIQKALFKFEELNERSGEGSREMDEAAASAADLKQGSAK